MAVAHLCSPSLHPIPSPWDLRSGLHHRARHHRGYLFNIALLKVVFRPLFQLHWVKKTWPYKITTRWTMVMAFMPLPWKPELVFTGTSDMGVNPDTMNLPESNQETIRLRKVEGGFFAAVKFSGKPTEDIVLKKDKDFVPV
ncbi:hypothetical protein MLD38_006622 [Melastoma candidum]|uniref:Uncharacterized protein n=1 Tax=Melastoma candidum TaxID=119954 RepID=A0ACB9RNH6_9MYRT|nr:hypothetical protein MLD38_006622 [Melastoma candidum]